MAKPQAKKAPSAEEQRESLKTVIEESLAQNQETPMIPVQPKRKRGRPRKHPLPEQAELGQAEESGEPAVDPGPPVEIPKAALKPALELPFALIARRTGFEGFRLTDEELDDLVPLVEQTVKAYAPALHGPNAAALMLAGSVGLLALTKYLAFAGTDPAAPKAEEPAKQEQSPAPLSPLFPTVAAGPGA